MLELKLDYCQCLKYGIDVHKLKAGTLILAITKNSLYKITKGIDQYEIMIQGGKILEPVAANFSGSTFGGSMLKLGWIGYNMHMELFIPSLKGIYRTTGVRAAKIIGEGWEYDMEWESMDIGTEPKINEKTF